MQRRVEEDGITLGGRYRLGARLGAGGMGEVFEATHVALGRRVAVKRLAAHLAGERQHLARFHREAILASSLEHPHIVPVIDIDTEAEPPFYVMELQDGPTVSDRVRAEGPLPPASAIRMGRQVLSALSAAHARGIVHRDVKPSNIVSTRGYDGGEVAKLVDFGIAHLASSPSHQRLTATGQILGTPRYLAPEQADGGAVDARTDVYGVAATMFAAIAGRPPFDGTPGEILAAKFDPESVPDLAAERPDLGPLGAVLRRAMDPDPANRFASAAAMEEALAACEPGSRATLAEVPGRSPALAILVALLVATAAVAGIGVAIAWSRAEPEPSPHALEAAAPTAPEPAPMMRPNPPSADVGIDPEVAVEPTPIALPAPDAGAPRRRRTSTPGATNGREGDRGSRPPPSHEHSAAHDRCALDCSNRYNTSRCPPDQTLRCHREFTACNQACPP
ncbi:MAG: serine/threonine-protein kinase [Sandaracinaceae bacterium]